VVDRPVGDADANAFQEQTVEVREMAEVPVVRKQARVVEEVVVGKQVQERTETVRGTVRRQDVQVEDQRRVGVGAVSGYDTDDADFRSRFQTHAANSGSTDDQAGPGYRYGVSLARDPQYRAKEWSAIEADVRQHWEERNLNTWDAFKDEIRYAWEKARGKA
jgi:hypothetical protein